MSDDVIRIEEQFYILATSSRADERTRVLKHGDTFAVFDHYGDVVPFGLGEQGVYHGGTRFLSRMEVRIDQRRPLLLSSSVRDTNELLAVDLTNPDIRSGSEILLPRGTIHVFRSKFLWQGRCYERFRVSNHGMAAAQVALSLSFDSDFADIFEVRGTKRKARGEHLADGAAGAGGTNVITYRGLDGIVRRTRLDWAPAPDEISRSTVSFDLHLEPQQSAMVNLTLTCEDGTAEPPPPLAYDQALTVATGAIVAGRRDSCTVETSNEQFNDWFNRSMTDLHMMITEMESGPYPYAGVPWYSTPFGRDGIITALEMLWVAPAVAAGVLRFLAATQATGTDPVHDAEPGKILHEMRRGEMAALGEVPFGRYYGSVDATPLFVVLAGAYYQRTGDLDLVQTLWPNVERALAWIESCGDADGDGFVEYARQSTKGLVHQGWKDSHDAVFHADGVLAEPPIALCEVQGHVFDAFRTAAALAAVLGQEARAVELQRRAEVLRQRFEETFWIEDLQTYALALDGHKQPCRVRTSNAGQCLFSGIVGAERARKLAVTLLQEDSFSGWGVRTLSAAERRYNPMSYHNGSVWPHDNALIAAGLARYGLTQPALALLTGIFDMSIFVELHRLPELVCGFRRRPAEGPTLYPVACSPQSWAAAAILLLLQSALGLSIDGPGRRIVFSHSALPPSLREIRIKNLRVAGATLDLALHRYEADVDVVVTGRSGDVEVVILK